MPIIQSAKKRVKVANKATIRNRKTKRSVKSSIKALFASLEGDKKQVDVLIVAAQSELDTAVKKGVLHKNKASRKKAQLAKAVKDAGFKPTAKPVVKKTTAKPKTAAKKPATKKSPAKKVATKKPATKKVA